MTSPVDVLHSTEVPHVVEVVLNRPERRNALTGPLVVALAEALRAVAEEPETSVIVLRGAGGAFCSGLDLTEFGHDPPHEWIAEFPRLWRAVHEALYDLPCIVIGALERAAVNGGASLALACDFLIAGHTAFLQVGEIQQGMAAPMNMAWLRLRHSEAVAARVALLGDRIVGPDLVTLGLATSTVADDRVVPEALELARRLAGHDTAGVRRIKRSLRGSGLGSSATTWFDRVLDSDPLGSLTQPPQAAQDR